MKAALVGLVLLSMLPAQAAKHYNYRVCNLIVHKCMIA
jgi:hypothetical protein